MIFLWNPSTCRLEENLPAIYPLLGLIEEELVLHKVESKIQTLILNKMLGLSEKKSGFPSQKIIFRKLYGSLRQLLLFILAIEMKREKRELVIEVGYFQDRDYANTKLVKSLFRHRQQSDLVNLYKKRAEKETPLIVHVRLGDYVHIPSMDLLGKEYYREAIELMWDPSRFKKIWIFSDSQINMANFLPSKLVNLCDSIDDENFTALDLLEVMSLGNGYVISNSTLSWWAAVLSPLGHSNVAAPHPWFSKLPNRENLYFENWLKIERKR